ncbi:DDE-type integrase/transposase/recombinase, partial [Enterobacter cloacae complex sp. GF14B]|uniref:DDE-type integrase/transposase/recombinase n=1 Tax=Enterobacter cloacae complex sp. GF14B TaxID=2511982 RepID=UPI001026C503
AKFLFENIITRFGCPFEIVSDNGTHFINEVIRELTTTFMISHHKSTPYYPQANGQAESTNKTLISILTKTVEAHRTDWDLKLTSALWAYRTAYKVAINCTPFKMVYGQEAVMPWEFVIPSLRVASQEGWDGNPLVERLYILERLDEERQLAVQNALVEKDRRKKWFDRHLKNKDINVGDKVLMYGVRNEKKKLKYAGKGPYRVCEITPQGTIRVETLDGVETIGFLNGSKFKRYYDPLIQEELCAIHTKKAAKAQIELKKIQAQAEAKERQQRIRQKREANLGVTHAFHVEIDEDWLDSDTPLRYPIELNNTYGKVLYNALLDTGAKYNLLSYGVWCQLGKPPLSESIIQVKGVNKKKTLVFGIWHTSVSYDNGVVAQDFLVMLVGTMEGHISLLIVTKP